MRHRARRRPNCTARCRRRWMRCGAAPARRVPTRSRDAWIRSLRTIEDEERAGEAADLGNDRAPLHPMRIYGELMRMLGRDAIVVGDGGDFVSYAGRVLDSYQPGCWLDPGPLGCLGSGPGYALAAKLAHPERQVVLLLGDGAFGFSGMEFDTLARHPNVPVLALVGNNGIWALEKHPMEAVYGYSVAADLAPRHPLRPGRRGSRLPRRVRRSAGGASSGAGPCSGVRPSGARQRAHGPRGGVPAAVEPRVTPARNHQAARRPAENEDPTRPHAKTGNRRAHIRKPPAFSAGGFRSRFGPIGTGRGTCQKGPVRVARTAGGADVCGFARAYVGSRV